MADSVTTFTHSGRHEIVFTEGNHRYKVDGAYKQGVTTVIAMLAKDALAPWAASMVIKYIEENCVLVDDTHYEVSTYALTRAKRHHASFRDSAADVGTRVHHWIEQHLVGNDEAITKDMEPSVKAYLQWELAHMPEVAWSERVTYSEELDLCGTTDLIAIIDGHRTVLDFKTGHPEAEYNPRERRKTGRGRAYTTVFMQDAFYDIAAQEEDGVYAERYAALYLPVTGDFFYYTTDDVELYRDLARSLRKTQQLYEGAKFRNKFNGTQEHNT